MQASSVVPFAFSNCECCYSWNTYTQLSKWCAEITHYDFGPLLVLVYVYRPRRVLEKEIDETIWYTHVCVYHHFFLILRNREVMLEHLSPSSIPPLAIVLIKCSGVLNIV